MPNQRSDARMRSEHQDLIRRFGYRPCDEAQQARCAKIRYEIELAASAIVNHAPASLERTASLDTLQVALMWAVQAIAREEQQATSQESTGAKCKPLTEL